MCWTGTDLQRIFPPGRVVLINTGQGNLAIQTEVHVGFLSLPCQPQAPSLFWLQSQPAGLLQLLFIYLFIFIALRFWLRMILGSLGNKDKSDLPCIPRAA